MAKKRTAAAGAIYREAARIAALPVDKAAAIIGQTLDEIIEAVLVEEAPQLVAEGILTPEQGAALHRLRPGCSLQ